MFFIFYFLKQLVDLYQRGRLVVLVVAKSPTPQSDAPTTSSAAAISKVVQLKRKKACDLTRLEKLVTRLDLT